MKQWYALYVLLYLLNVGLNIKGGGGEWCDITSNGINILKSARRA